MGTRELSSNQRLGSRSRQPRLQNGLHASSRGWPQSGQRRGLGGALLGMAGSFHLRIGHQPDRPAGAAGQVGDPAGMRLDSIGNGRTRGQLQRAGADHALRLAQKQGGIGRDRIESHLLDQRWPLAAAHDLEEAERSEEQKSELQSLMSNSYSVFML